MVGACKNSCQSSTHSQTFRLWPRLSSRRQAQRRNVVGSGDRMGSLQCRAARSQSLLAQIASQA
jgi:hypothetical protein